MHKNKSLFKFENIRIVKDGKSVISSSKVSLKSGAKKRLDDLISKSHAEALLISWERELSAKATCLPEDDFDFIEGKKIANGKIERKALEKLIKQLNKAKTKTESLQGYLQDLLNQAIDKYLDLINDKEGKYGNDNQ
jgi:hypothetical protein